LVAVALFLVAIGLVLESRRRHGLYWYDTGADYRFPFVTEEVQRIPGRLEAAGMVLPPWESKWESAFVGLSVKPRLTAIWFEPAIDVLVDGEPTCRQFFERSASGRRYANLCLRSDDVRPGAIVSLRGRHLRLPDQPVELLLFNAPDLNLARILVLAPHPDDAEIAAFGLYSGRESWVVTVTTGSYPGRVYEALAPDVVDRNELQARLRVWDSLVVPRWGGVDSEHSMNLGYFTGTLESMHAEPAGVVPNPSTGSTDVDHWRSYNRTSLLRERPAISTWGSLVEDLTDLAARIEPSIIVAPHPALDANRDHVYTTAALLEALERLGDPDVDLFLYTNHHVLSEYFPFGPADAAVTLPPWSDSTVTFRTVYSLALDAGRQRDKLFALDQMHDLRPAPERVLQGPTGALLHRIKRAVAELWRDPAQEYSYFRRAVRPNELFFVYDAADREALQQFVSRLRARNASIMDDASGSRGDTLR
jgi:LmbE family N-acetylglucosaminyl deacetylase